MRGRRIASRYAAKDSFAKALELSSIDLSKERNTAINTVAKPFWQSEVREPMIYCNGKDVFYDVPR